jgi:hypothetical protein
MKITDLIVEQQIDELTAADVGQGVGKAAGAVGAVAGGVKGAWQAAKKGFEKGRATVAGETPPQQAAAPGQPAPQAAPAAGNAPQGNANDPAGIQQQIKQKELELKDLQGKLRAAQKGADNAAKAEKDAAQTQQAQQVATAPAAEPAAPAAAPSQAAPDAATQARIAAAPQGYDGETGKPVAAPQQAAAAPAAEPAPTQQAAAAPAAEPAPQQQTGGKLTAAQQAAKVAELKGKRAAGKTAGTTGSGFNQYTKDASSQRIVGANADGSPKIQTIKASKINIGNNLSESLARKVEQHKRKMFETGLTNGTSSVFVK